MFKEIGEGLYNLVNSFFPDRKWKKFKPGTFEDDLKAMKKDWEKIQKDIDKIINNPNKGDK